MKAALLACITLATLTGCASRVGTSYVPVVDLKGMDVEQYNTDLAECRLLAEQRPGAGPSAVAGAVVIGLVGAAIAPRGYRNELARDGMVAGGVSGAGAGLATQNNIVRRCLMGRGYSVLD